MSENSIIRISVVSYLNSKPFLYGLRDARFKSKIEISEDIPSACAEKLIKKKADIGLVPVAILPELKEHTIISKYCIGADGPVNSVLLLSDVPLNEIKVILLDYQSRTSVMLARILAEKYWKIDPAWESTTEDYEKQINNNTAGVVIGDRALKIKKNYRYVYDLSGEWKKYTGLPFVFACWVSVKKLDADFVNDFENALKKGLENINEIAEKEGNENYSKKDIIHYLSDCINFNFDEPKRKALTLFLQLAGEVKNENRINQRDKINVSFKKLI